MSYYLHMPAVDVLIISSDSSFNSIFYDIDIITNVGPDHAI